MHEQLTRWWSGISLRTKVTGVTVMLVTLGLLVAGLGTMSVLRTYLIEEVDRQIAEQAKTVIQQENPSTMEGDSFPSDTSSRLNFYYAAVDADGHLLDDNLRGDQKGIAPDVSTLTLLHLQSVTGGITLFNESRTTEWRVVAIPGVWIVDSEPVTLLVGLNLQDTNALIARFGAIFMFFGLTIVILGGALTRLLVTSTFSPLREVEATAARFAAGDFSQRLTGATPNTEVGRLNRSLNSMLNRIDRAFSDRAKTIEQMRRFVGDASHELRTPLVSVRGYAELYRMGALQKPEDVAQAMERIEKEAIRMGELVEDLLELARLDEAKPLQLTAVDLVPIANDAAMDAMASAPDRTVTVVITEPTPVPADEQEDTATAPLPVQGRAATLATGPIAFAGATLARLRSRRPRPERESDGAATAPATVTPETRAIVSAEENKIRQVLANLLGNAMRFTPDDSPIEIGIEVDPPRSTATLSVIDHGEGIPPQIREKIFQRFWRADSSRNRGTGGSGLGLAIVSGIIQAHKGHVDVVETPGGGATFRVSLPLLQDEKAPQEVPSAQPRPPQTPTRS